MIGLNDNKIRACCWWRDAGAGTSPTPKYDPLRTIALDRTSDPHTFQ